MMNGNTIDTIQTETISKYDRLRGSLKDVALFTKPSTILTVESLTGRAETFIIETCRFESAGKDGGDYIFIQAVDANRGVVRLVLPPRASSAIASQRDSLTRRRRSVAAKRRGAALTDEQRQVLRDRLAKARQHRPAKPAKRKVVSK